MRLFSALVPPAAAVDHLVTWLGERTAGLPPELRATLRWTPVQRWHVTFGFFGDDDDPVRRTRWLRRRASGRPAPTLRLAGGGTFPGVLWIGVSTDDERRFAQLARAAGAGRRDYHPHLTVARWRNGRPERDALTAAVAGYSGPWFTPDAVVLLRSEPGQGGPTYTMVERLPLVRD